MSKADAPLLEQKRSASSLRRMDSVKKAQLFRAKSGYAFDESTGAYIATKAEKATEMTTLLKRTTSIVPSTPLIEAVSSVEEVSTGQLTNTFETTVNATLALVGAGVLGIPATFKEAGVVMGCVMIALCGVTLLTAVLIGNICTELGPVADELKVPKASRDWPFMGFSAYGDAGRGFAGAIFILELWAILITYLIANGENLEKLFNTEGQKSMWVMVCGVVSFFLLFLSQKVLSYCSFLGILAIVGATVCLIWSGLAQDTWAVYEEEINWLDITKAPSAIGVLQFCFVAHSAFPCIYRNMENTENYNKAMTIAFTCAGVFYLVFGLLGYIFYGSKTDPVVLKNIGTNYDGTDIPGLRLCQIIPLAGFALNLQTSFPVYAAGLLAATESWLGITDKSVIVRTVWKLVFMGITALMAATLCDMFQPVQSMVGCICATCTCLLMPIAFAWKVCGGGNFVKLLSALGIVYGMFILVSGTFLNIQNIMNPERS